MSYDAAGVRASGDSGRAITTPPRAHATEGNVVKASSPSLPAAVREAAMSTLGASPVTEELAWMSWAGTVWRLTAGDRSVYVKRADTLSGERDRLVWLEGRWPVPEVI